MQHIESSSSGFQAVVNPLATTNRMFSTNEHVASTADSRHASSGMCPVGREALDLYHDTQQHRDGDTQRPDAKLSTTHFSRPPHLSLHTSMLSLQPNTETAEPSKPAVVCAMDHLTTKLRIPLAMVRKTRGSSLQIEQYLQQLGGLAPSYPLHSLPAPEEDNITAYAKLPTRTGGGSLPDNNSHLSPNSTTDVVHRNEADQLSSPKRSATADATLTMTLPEGEAPCSTPQTCHLPGVVPQQAKKPTAQLNSAPPAVTTTTLATPVLQSVGPPPPAICLLFLQKKCHQHEKCHQVHVNRKELEGLRAEIQRQPVCCTEHNPCDTKLGEWDLSQLWKSALNDAMTAEIDVIALRRSPSPVDQAIVVAPLPTSGKSTPSATTAAYSSSSSSSPASNGSPTEAYTALLTPSVRSTTIIELRPFQLAPSAGLRKLYIESLVHPVPRNDHAHDPQWPMGSEDETCKAATAALPNRHTRTPKVCRSLEATTHAVCRLHHRGPWCRFGDECRFLHICRSVSNSKLFPGNRKIDGRKCENEPPAPTSALEPASPQPIAQHRKPNGAHPSTQDEAKLIVDCCPPEQCALPPQAKPKEGPDDRVPSSPQQSTMKVWQNWPYPKRAARQ